MGRGKSRKQAGQRAAVPRAGTDQQPDSQPGQRPAAIQPAGDGQRKIKRSLPFLLASCVVLIIWFAILAALAWHSTAASPGL